MYAVHSCNASENPFEVVGYAIYSYKNVSDCKAQHDDIILQIFPPVSGYYSFPYPLSTDTFIPYKHAIRRYSTFINNFIELSFYSPVFFLVDREKQFWSQFIFFSKNKKRLILILALKKPLMMYFSRFVHLFWCSFIACQMFHYVSLSAVLLLYTVPENTVASNIDKKFSSLILNC